VSGLTEGHVTTIAARRRCGGIELAVFIGWAPVAFGAASALAEPQGSPTAQSSTARQPSADQLESEYNGQDITRPQRSFETRFQFRTSEGTTSRTDRDTMLLKYNSKIDLEAGWKLGLLAQVPLVDKTTRTFDPQSSDTEAGIGDSAFQAVLSHAIDRRWAFGFGARLVAPTAEDALGAGKWQIMPGFGVRYSFLELGPNTYFVPAVRYAMSVAGDPTKRNISQPQIAPTLNIGLPDRWFVTFYPSFDVRINYGDSISGQTGRLFLPFDVAVGRKVTDGLTISLEGSVPVIKDYPVYNFKTELKIVMQF
jgi:hypothetical protein